MKKHFGIILAFVLSLTMVFSTTAFAAENTDATSNPVIVESSEDSPMLAGTLSGYGSVWHNASDPTSGNFYVNVTGSSWVTAQLTLNIENFGPNDAVAVQVFKPNGTLAYGTLDNSGDYITMANKDNWHNISFYGGATGQYRVHYSIINWYGNTPSSGRINCWIY